MEFTQFLSTLCFLLYMQHHRVFCTCHQALYLEGLDNQSVEDDARQDGDKPLVGLVVAEAHPVSPDEEDGTSSGGQA